MRDEMRKPTLVTRVLPLGLRQVVAYAEEASNEKQVFRIMKWGAMRGASTYSGSIQQARCIQLENPMRIIEAWKARWLPTT